MNNGTFNTTRLAGNRMLVSGYEAEQRAILDTTEWDEIKHQLQHKAAADYFDTKVAEFFAPITEATDAVNSMLEQAHAALSDPAFSLVVEPGTEGVEPEPRIEITLGRDAAILRLLESGDTSRLIWVGDTIEIVALVNPTFVAYDPTADNAAGVDDQA